MGGRTRFGLAAAIVVLTAVAVPTGVALAATGRPTVDGQNPVPTATAAPPTAAPTANPTSNPTTVPTVPTVPTVVVPTPGPTPAELAAQAAAAAAAKAAAEQAAALAKAQAEAARKAQERAAKLAIRTARAAAQGNAAWAKHGKPDKLVIIHQSAIDTFSNGQLVQHVERSGVSVNIATLDSVVPAGWLTIDGGNVRLAAAVIMTPGTLLDISGVDTFALAGGGDPTAAAFLSSGSGRIRIRGTTVTSYDPGGSGAVDPKSTGRPYIAVSRNGRLDVTDATISDLGTSPTNGDGWHPAVAFGTGSTGTLTRATFARDSTGVRLSKSQGVQLQDVTIGTSAGDGLILAGDTGTTMAGIKAVNNAGAGVSVSGDSTDRAISGITTSKNGSFGVAITGQTNTQVHDLTLNGDAQGGLELNRANGVTVRDVTTTDADRGVFVHVFSQNVTLDRLTLTGGRTGVHVDKSTDGLHVTNSTITRSEVAGFSIGGKHSDVTDVTVRDTGSALKFERGAVGLVVTKLSVIGGTDGLVASGGTSGLIVKDLSTDGVNNDGLRSASEGLQVTGGRIGAHNTGMAIEAGTTVTGTSVGPTGTGVRVRTPSAVTLTGVTVEAISLGLDVDKAGQVTLRDSAVHALQSVRGPITELGVNDLSLPALNLLGAIGVPLLGIAVALELAHLARSRSVRSSGSGGRGRPVQPPVLAGAR